MNFKSAVEGIRVGILHANFPEVGQMSWAETVQNVYKTLQKEGIETTYKSTDWTWSMEGTSEKMGLSQEGNCRFCEGKAETAEHIWVECPALLVRRLRHLGKPTVTPEEVRELGPRKVIGFGKSLKLEWV